MNSTEIQNPSIADAVEKAFSPQWNVILWNDDYHKIGYVIESLQVCANVSHGAAITISLEAHNSGKSIACTSNFELAEHYRDRLLSRGLTVTLDKTA